MSKGNCKENPMEYNGLCCCNCKHQLELKCHPINKEFGKGSIMKSCGYVCIIPVDDGSMEGQGIFFDKKHGICEMHYLKT